MSRSRTRIDNPTGPRARARQVEGDFSLDRRGRIGQIISACEQARTGEPREGRRGELPASGRNDAGHHHGERLPLGATPDA